MGQLTGFSLAMLGQDWPLALCVYRTLRSLLHLPFSTLNLCCWSGWSRLAFVFCGSSLLFRRYISRLAGM